MSKVIITSDPADTIAAPEQLALIEADEAARALSVSDGAAFRVLEDLLSLLETKGLLTVAELPQAAQDKINKRKADRAKL